MHDQSQQQQQVVLIRHTDAAMLLGVNEKQLRARDAIGRWLYKPHLRRLQRGRKCRIWMLRAEVQEELSRELEAVKPEPTIAQEQRDELATLLASLGAERAAARLLR